MGMGSPPTLQRVANGEVNPWAEWLRWRGPRQPRAAFGRPRSIPVIRCDRLAGTGWELYLMVLVRTGIRMDDLFAERVLSHRTLTRSELLALAGTPHAVLDCEIAGIDLSDLDLSQWSFEKCRLRGTNFHGAKLERTTWRSCRVAFASFVGCDLSESSFVNSDLNNASLRRSNLDGAKIAGCKLTGADMTDVRALEIRLEETLLISAKMPGRDFRKTTLTRLDFSQADLSKCDFRYATFVDCSLRDALLDAARFEGADLRGADLGGVRLGDASQFRGATISREQASQLLGEVGLKVR